jgi:HSP20 family molecular chaperone IbpA
MLHKLLLTSLVASASLFASSTYIPNLNAELAHNKQLIKEYKEGIKELEKRDTFLISAKKSSPKLYEEKAPFEETKTAYIQRIKLDGAEAKDISFKIEKHMLSLEMNIKRTRNDKDGYYQSSRSFFQEYSIPKNVKESKITTYVDGDYFVIKMPKK